MLFVGWQEGHPAGEKAVSLVLQGYGGGKLLSLGWYLFHIPQRVEAELASDGKLANGSSSLDLDRGHWDDDGHSSGGVHVSASNNNNNNAAFV